MFIAIVTFVLLTVWPELIDGNNGSGNIGQHIKTQQQQHQQQQQQILETSTMSSHKADMSVRRNDMLALVAYLGAFATHFGAQIWMTFVSGKDEFIFLFFKFIYFFLLCLSISESFDTFILNKFVFHLN